MNTAAFWNENGFALFEDFLSIQDFNFIFEKAEEFLNGKFRDAAHRSDLSGESKKLGKERITQIMRPSLTDPSLMSSSLYHKVIQTAQYLLGEDADIDFDMIINKLPKSNTPTPWHQDAAYWPEMHDKRACSFWIALDPVDQENGCMMYVPKTHLIELRKHDFKKEGGALETQIRSEDKIFHGVLQKGGCIAHHGHTLHGALGNKSARQRRAWIINCRPKKMIKFLRENGYDHLGKRDNKS